MTRDQAKKKYENLFNSVELKAAAFDKIAEKYYFGSFGSTTKTDFDVLMFSIYLDQILDSEQNNFTAYSDYTLSKCLGITQSKISNLKVKKELIYPYEKFNWRESFSAISERAVYEDGKIKLFVPDKNLYIEIKNAIEGMGGFVEVQLTSNLLQVKLAYFLDLIISISDDVSRDHLRKNIRKKIKENAKDVSILESESFGKALTGQVPEMIINIIGDCIPVFGGVVKTIATNLYETIKK